MRLTNDSVIDDLGGTGVVSSELALSKGTVSLWRERGIPPGRWPSIVRLAKRKGQSHITFEALARLRPAPSSPADARASA